MNPCHLFIQPRGSFRFADFVLTTLKQTEPQRKLSNPSTQHYMFLIYKNEWSIGDETSNHIYKQ